MTTHTNDANTITGYEVRYDRGAYSADTVDEAKQIARDLIDPRFPSSAKIREIYDDLTFRTIIEIPNNA